MRPSSNQSLFTLITDAVLQPSAVHYAMAVDGPSVCRVSDANSRTKERI